MPKITELYGEDCVEFRENSIVVTIPFERLETKVYVSDGDKNVPVPNKNAPVNDENVPVIVPVENENMPDKRDKTELILEFCHKPKTVLEIAGYLGYKDKRSVRKYLNVLLSQGRISMTIPDKPNSSKQKYITIN